MPLAATLRTLVCLLALGVLAPAMASATDRRGVDPHSPNPLAGERWYVDSKEPSFQQWLSYRASGQTANANLMWRIAGTPKFRWFGRFTSPPKIKVRRFIDAAQATGSVPLITVMRHQGKQCSAHYTGGGATEDARSRRWYREFAEGVGSSRVVIAYEPDSLGTVKCLSKKSQRARLDLLRYGVDTLSRLPNATIYLEGGASDWEPAARVAKKLRYIGVRKVRGFMVNVTHYDWTANNIRFGRQISKRVGGKPFVISTAMNGRGPVHYKRVVGGRTRVLNVWCHPQNRGLGTPPTTNTYARKVDAYLWINRPGYSGGSCNGGPSRVGAWWADRGLQLARYATSWKGPPRGSRFGFPSGRLSLAAAAGDQLRR
jgi:endoglucanase